MFSYMVNYICLKTLTFHFKLLLKLERIEKKLLGLPIGFHKLGDKFERRTKFLKVFFSSTYQADWLT